MRTIQINNKKIKSQIDEKTKLSERMIEIGKASEKLEKEYKEIMQKMTRIDEKVRPEIKRVAETIEQNEFEQLSRVFVDKKGLFFEIADRLEEFKVAFKQKKDAASVEQK